MSNVECYQRTSLRTCVRMIAYTIAFLLQSGATGDGIQPLVFNGVPTTIEQHPHLVSIQQRTHKCGGVIIDKNIVLSAAHCFQPETKIENLRIVAGRTKHRDQTKFEQILTVDSIVKHTGYDDKKFTHDIALVKTHQEFQWRKWVRPAMLTPEWSHTAPEITIAGWGITEDNVTSNQLLKTDLKIVDDELCKSRFKTYYQPVNTFCIYENKTDTCKGDSGSAVVNKVGEVIGIVSYGTVSCGKAESVATNVTHYLNWIDETVRELNSECKVYSEMRHATIKGLEIPSEALLKHNEYVQSTMLIQQKLCGGNSIFKCFNKVCYCYMPNKLKLTYLQSAIACQEFFNGTLPTVTSQEENDFIGTLQESKSSGLWLRFWLQEANTTFTNWAPGKAPSDPGSCIVLAYDLTWHDHPCTKALQSVCRIPYVKSKCKPGWASYLNHCYQVIPRHLTWKEAEKTCKDGHLVSIVEQEENILINKLLRTVGLEKAWIGLTTSEGETKWTDNSPTKYTNWELVSKRPTQDDVESCAVFVSSEYSKHAKWRSISCSVKYPSVCKVPHDL